MDARDVVLSAMPPAGPARRPRALCVGLVASDFLATVAFPVPRDVKVRADRIVRQGGGPAANAATALARLGVVSAFAGAVGDDALGAEQRAELAREGIDVAGVRAVPGRPSFVSFILVDPRDGARTIVSAPDERPRLPPDGGVLPDPPPDLVLVDGWDVDAQRPIGRAARAIGVPVLLDAGSCRPDTLALLPVSDVVIASEPFSDEWTGPGRAEETVARLLAAGARLAAVTRGAAGVVAGAAGAADPFEVPAFRTEVVDTTGAGDAFHGGAAWALLEGQPWGEALRRAAAVAALKCRRAGARAGLPDAEAVVRFLRG